MRAFALQRYDTAESATWDEVRSLMDRIESGEEGRPEFTLWEGGDGPRIVDAGLAVIAETAAWVLRRSKGRTSDFLAYGHEAEYYQCIYLGCPHFIRDCCLLSRANAEIGLAALVDRRKL